jgi:putative transposase
MPRIARVVVPKYPHHVTQRGNRRQTVFFSAEDYATYIELLANARDNAGVEIWAYTTQGALTSEKTGAVI